MEATTIGPAPASEDIEHARHALAREQQIPEEQRQQRLITGTHIALARAKLGLTPTQVAKEAGVDMGNLRNIEQGRGAWSQPLVEKVLAVLTRAARAAEASV